MKKITFVIITLFALASCTQQKIGFVDTGKIINDYQEKLDLEEKFKGKDDVFKKRADSISKAFQLEAQAFQVESKRLSQSKAQAKYEELGQKQQVLQQQMQFEQQQLTQAFQTEMDSVIIRVKDFVKGYGKQNGYSFILGTTDATSAVMYGKESEDLSEVILNTLNENYKK